MRKIWAERGTKMVISKQKAPSVFWESPTVQYGWRTEAGQGEGRKKAGGKGGVRLWKCRRALKPRLKKYGYF